MANIFFQRISIYVDGMSVEKIKTRQKKKKSENMSAVAVRKRQPGPLGVGKNQKQHNSKIKDGNLHNSTGWIERLAMWKRSER